MNLSPDFQPVSITLLAELNRITVNTVFVRISSTVLSYKYSTSGRIDCALHFWHLELCQVFDNAHLKEHGYYGRRFHGDTALASYVVMYTGGRAT
jgi:hypothetical protein